MHPQDGDLEAGTLPIGSPVVIIVSTGGEQLSHLTQNLQSRREVPVTSGMHQAKYIVCTAALGILFTLNESWDVMISSHPYFVRQEVIHLKGTDYDSQMKILVWQMSQCIYKFKAYFT